MRVCHRTPLAVSLAYVRLGPHVAALLACKLLEGLPCLPFISHRSSELTQVHAIPPGFARVMSPHTCTQALYSFGLSLKLLS